MAKIEDNPFYQATMSDKLTPFGKAQVIEAMLSAPGADTLKEFKEYKKFLTAERKRVSAEVIKMTNPLMMKKSSTPK